jgi:hypothetical protein
VRRALCLLCLAAAATGCDEEFKPASVVEQLRVLGARAEPPEVRPGQVTELEVLAVDPTRAAKPTVFWIACDPDPFGQGRTACSTTETFEDPSGLDLSGELPPGMRIIGFGDRAAYAAPANLFDVLPADHRVRQEGTVALLLLLVVGEEVSPLAPREELALVFERVRNKETAALAALFRVTVSERAAPNQNPKLALVRYGEDEPVPGAHLLFQMGEQRQFTVAATDDSYEVYRQRAPDGELVEKTERQQVAWFSTSGRFSEDVLALDSAIPEKFTAPGIEPRDLLPPNRLGTTWAVLRDSRGGIAWKEQPFFSCDTAIFGHPNVTRVQSPTAPGELLVLEGENLGSIVDVILGTTVVKGVFSAARGTWEGEPKGVASGTWPLELRSADCSAGPQSATVTIP